MNQKTETEKKQHYSKPQIEIIKLDSGISLQLDSPPIAPGEPGYIGKMTPEYFNNEPFKEFHS